MKINRLGILIVFLVIVGCHKPPKPIIEPRYKVQLEMSPTLKEAVMNLVWMKSDPNIFKVKEVDPFRKNQ